MAKSIFISSRSSLRELRDAAERAVTLAGMKPVRFEHDAAQGSPTLEKLDRTIARCDAVLLIAGLEYGWVPEPDWGFGADGEKSITWIEAEIAKSQRKELMAFELLDDDSPESSSPRDTGGQQQFLERLRQISAPRTVTSATCAVEMTRALQAWQQRSGLWGVLCKWLSLGGCLPGGTRRASRVTLGTLAVVAIVIALLSLRHLGRPEPLAYTPTNSTTPLPVYRYGSTQVEFQAGNFFAMPARPGEKEGFGRVSVDALAVSAKIDFERPHQKTSLDNRIAGKEAEYHGGVDKYHKERKCWFQALPQNKKVEFEARGYWVKRCPSGFSKWTPERTLYFLAGIAAQASENGEPKKLSAEDANRLIGKISLGAADLCRTAAKDGQDSLALPLFGTGAAGLPWKDKEKKERSAQAILRGVNRAAMEGRAPKTIVLVNYPGYEWSTAEAEGNEEREDVVRGQWENHRELVRGIFDDEFLRYDDWHAGGWPHRREAWTIFLVGIQTTVLLVVPVFVHRKRLPPRGHWIGAMNLWIALAIIPAAGLWGLAGFVSTLWILVCSTLLFLGAMLFLSFRFVVPSAFLPPVYETHMKKVTEA